MGRLVPKKSSGMKGMDLPSSRGLLIIVLLIMIVFGLIMYFYLGRNIIKAFMGLG